jgi:hypothetical protein
MARGTVAAEAPDDVPVIRRVSGMIAMAKMMKGTELVKSTIISKSLFNLGAANKPPSELVARNAPRGSPTNALMAAAAATMYRV